MQPFNFMQDASKILFVFDQGHGSEGFPDAIEGELHAEYPRTIRNKVSSVHFFAFVKLDFRLRIHQGDVSCEKVTNTFTRFAVHHDHTFDAAPRWGKERCDIACVGSRILRASSVKHIGIDHV